MFKKNKKNAPIISLTTPELINRIGLAGDPRNKSNKTIAPNADMIIIGFKFKLLSCTLYYYFYEQPVQNRPEKDIYQK